MNDAICHGFLRHNDLVLRLPQGWEDGSQIIVLGPHDGAFRPNLVYSSEPARQAKTAEDFAELQRPQLEATLKEFQIIAEDEVQFGENHGFLRRHTFVMEQEKIEQLQFYIVVDDIVHTLTFTHLFGHLERFLHVAYRLFESAAIG